MTAKLLGRDGRVRGDGPRRGRSSRRRWWPPTARRRPRRTRRSSCPRASCPAFGGLHVDTASTALVGPGRRRALPRRVSVRLRRAAVLDGAGPGPRRRPRRRLPPARNRSGEAQGRGGRDVQGARRLPVRGRRVRVLEGRVPHGVAVPDELRDPRAPARPGPRPSRARRPCWPAPTRTSSRSSAGERPTNESWWPAYTAWQAFAVKVLAEGGRPQDSHVTRLYGFADRMPVFALGYLLDALTASGDGGPRAAELQRRIRNAVATRRRVRARGGAVRSVPALVLELERALDGGRPRPASSGARPTTRSSPGSCAGCSPRASRAAGATPRRTASPWRRSSTTTRRRRRSRPTSAPSSASAARRWPRAEFHGRTHDRARSMDVPMKTLAGKGAPGTAPGPLAAPRGDGGHALLHRAPEVRGGRARAGRAGPGIPHRARLRSGHGDGSEPRARPSRRSRRATSSG